MIRVHTAKEMKEEKQPNVTIGLKKTRHSPAERPSEQTGAGTTCAVAPGGCHMRYGPELATLGPHTTWHLLWPLWDHAAHSLHSSNSGAMLYLAPTLATLGHTLHPSWSRWTLEWALCAA